MNSLITLTECLVPFIAKKVSTRLLWSNDLDDSQREELKQATNYLIEEKQRHAVFDTCVPLLTNEKIFYAERYGGGAISRNGGGARCGFDGRWQVKGISANALVGKGSRRSMVN
ncbi:mchC domain protein [Klebsiella indica]|uniref:MchC domain protein n=1 Tax=Klebsiella indica TaxID=2582917 RepID=A0A5R9L8G2_9ENTR|nr:mchC domain protein [Klebsiella indica]TLV05008.1 mchC domain protein [Klebsiella indica]